ncbi:hypothetical protein AAVH_09506 [Aphelenchoides avenae]|nr:hypothetical protein AAVH_09506 [Aphelenchus avenae]
MDFKAIAERHDRVMEKARKQKFPNWDHSILDDLTKPLPRIEVRLPRDGPVPHESFVIVAALLASKIALLMYLIVRFAMTFRKRNEAPAAVEMVAIRENAKNEVEEKLLQNSETLEERAAKKARMIEDVD